MPLAGALSPDTSTGMLSYLSKLIPAVIDWKTSSSLSGGAGGTYISVFSEKSKGILANRNLYSLP
jgi:hypothetical protein